MKLHFKGMEEYLVKKIQRSRVCTGYWVPESQFPLPIQTVILFFHFTSPALNHTSLCCGYEDPTVGTVTTHLSLLSMRTFAIMLCPNSWLVPLFLNAFIFHLFFPLALDCVFFAFYLLY